VFSDVANDFYERVEECLAEARQAHNVEEKAAWLALAEEWLSLARQAELSCEDILAPERNKVPA